MTTMGRSMMITSALALLPIISSTQVFAAYSDQMKTVQAVTGATGQQFEALNDRAKELGRTLSFTASQVAGGMIDLARAGFAPREIDAAIRGMLDLARATGTEVSRAAEIAAGTLRAFSLAAKESTRVADVLTATANNSAQTLEELGQSMAYVAPIAEEYGLSLEQTSKMLGVLANFQIKSSKSGTALRMIMLKLSDPAIQKRIEGMGVAVKQLNGELRDPADLLLDIGKAMAGMTGGERLAIGKELFDMRAMGAGLKLAKADFPKLSAAIDNAAGAAKRTAGIMDSALGGAFRRMRSAIEGTQIALGEALETELGQWSIRITELAGKMTAWTKTHQQAVIMFTEVAAAMGGAGAVSVLVGMQFAALGAILGGLTTAWVALTTNPWVLGITAGVAAVSLLNIAMNQAAAVTTDLSNKYASLLERQDKRRAADYAQMQRLEQLAAKEKLSNAEMGEAEKIIARMQQRYGDLGLSVNKTTGAIDGMSDALGRWLGLVQKQKESELAATLFETEENMKSLIRTMRELEEPDLFGFWHGASQGNRNAEQRRLQYEFDKQYAKQESLQRQQRAMRGEGGIGAMLAGGGTGGTGAGADYEAIARIESATAFEKRMAGELHRLKIEMIEDERRREIEHIEAKYAKERAEAKALGVSTADIDMAQRLAIAQVDARHNREEAGNRRQLADETARLEIQLAKKGLDQRLALLGQERKKALEEAAALGLAPEDVKRKFGLMRQMAVQEDRGLSRVRSPQGTFSPYALAASGAGGNVQEKIAKATGGSLLTLMQILKQGDKLIAAIKANKLEYT